MIFLSDSQQLVQQMPKRNNNGELHFWEDKMLESLFLLRWFCIPHIHNIFPGAISFFNANCCGCLRTSSVDLHQFFTFGFCLNFMFTAVYSEKQGGYPSTNIISYRLLPAHLSFQTFCQSNSIGSGPLFSYHSLPPGIL